MQGGNHLTRITPETLSKIIKGGKSITDSKEHDLKVVEMVGETLHSIVLKGINLIYI